VDLSIDPATLGTPRERALYRGIVRAAALGLARRIAEECNGSGEVIRTQDRKLMGPTETVGHLATQPGYIAVQVAGRNNGQIMRQVLTGVFGEQLDTLDIADHLPEAVDKAAATLAQRAGAAGFSPHHMVDRVNGASWRMDEIADELCRHAARGLRRTGRSITAERIAAAAVDLLPALTSWGNVPIDEPLGC
jgi:hypothetical protein